MLFPSTSTKIWGRYGPPKSGSGKKLFGTAEAIAHCTHRSALKRIRRNCLPDIPLSHITIFTHNTPIKTAKNKISDSRQQNNSASNAAMMKRYIDIVITVSSATTASFSILYCTAPVLSFSGFVVPLVVVAPHTSYHELCWRADTPMTRHRCNAAQLKMANDEEEELEALSSFAGTENGVESKRKGALNLLQRFIKFTIRRRRRPLEQEDDNYDLEKAATLADDETINDDNEDAVKRNNTTASIISFTRQATSSPNIDLTGTWTPILTSNFKTQYDNYLKNCSQSFLFRKVVVNGIEYQREIIRQLDFGQRLEIIAMNPAGNWNRTLLASDAYHPFNATIVDPDKDTVNVEAWWEDNGTKHRSVLRGKPRVNGGVFETLRYLEKEAEEDVLVCESTFLPCELDDESSSSAFKYGHVVWRFRRVE